MNINYFYLLDKSTKKDDKIVFLVVRYKNSRFLLHTKERLEEKYWDAKTKKVKRNYPGAAELNYFLEQFMNHVKNNVRIIRAENPNIQFQDLRERVKDIYKDKPSNNFFDAIKQYLDTTKSTTSKSFIQNFNSLVRNLQKFEKIMNKKIDFDSISLSFFDEFQNHLISDLKLQNNTVAHKIRFIKMFMKWSVERGYTDNRQFEKFTGIKKTESYRFSLNPKVLKAIINAELNEKLSESRDVFLFQLYTGQRISDIGKYQYADAENKVWNLTQKKTKSQVSVPLCNYAFEILKKHGNKMPAINSKKINRHLKEIGKIAGLDAIITETEHRGSEAETKKYKKYEKLSTHIARHTFETVMTNAKINQQTIDAITGHKSQTMSSKYYHPDNNELIKVVNEAFDKFFSDD